MGMMGYIQIMLAARGKPKIIRTWSFFNVFHGNANGVGVSHVKNVFFQREREMWIFWNMHLCDLITL